MAFFNCSMASRQKHVRETLPQQMTCRKPGDDYSVQRLILGTHTSSQEQNYLMIAEVHLPLDETSVDTRKYDEKAGTELQVSTFSYSSFRSRRIWKWNCL